MHDGTTTSQPPPEPKPSAHVGGEKPDDFVGPYKLLSLIGEGGFGVVWLAERREPFVQRVALKIIKPGMDSKAVIARFEQERQALAVMDHPNIAKVLDGGVTHASIGSRPYFVMEHVKGEPITSYCDRQRLTTRQRLELFTVVCEAVQHAHTKGIIHRDIKPSNVLVATSESGPLVKVIDFGVAKAVSHTLTDKSVFTEAGQLIGTPEYMSPEQAEMGATDVDTRTDVYSLGVLLYELLTGLLPFDPRALRSEGYDAIRRVIREIDPPKPSTRLTTADAKVVSGIAMYRRSASENLARELRRELDWIPMKAIRKDRVERYESPASFARDVQRYLRGDALEAVPESAWYRARKLVRRHRVAVISTSVVIGALVLGMVTTTWGFFVAAQRGERERRAHEDLKLALGNVESAQRDAKSARADEALARRSSALETYIANLTAAYSAVKAGRPDAARARLEACAPNLQGWEWRYVMSASDNSIFHASDEGLFFESGALSDDGRRVVVRAGQYEETSGQVNPKDLIAWDIQSGQRALIEASDPEPPKPPGGVSIGGMMGVTITLPGPDGRQIPLSGAGLEGGIGSVEVNGQSGRALAVPSMSGTAWLYDLSRPEMPEAIGGAGADCTAARFGANADEVLTVSSDETVRLWRSDRNNPALTIRAHCGPNSRAALSADGNRILVCGESKVATVYNARDGAVLSELSVPEASWSDGRLNANGTLAVRWSTKDGVLVFDTSSGRVIASERSAARGFDSKCEFVPGADLLAVIGPGAGVWDYRAQRWLWHKIGTCRSLAVADDGAVVTVLSGDKALTINVRSGEPISSLQFQTAPLACFGVGDGVITAYAWPANGIGAGDYEGTVRAWAWCEGQFALLASPLSGAFTYFVDRAGLRGRLVDWRDSRVLQEWSIDRIPATGIFTERSDQDELRMFGRVSTIAGISWVPTASFSADGRTFTCVRAGGHQIDVVDTRSGSVARTIDIGEASATSIGLSGRGTFVASAHRTGLVRVWNTGSGELAGEFVSPKPVITRVVAVDSGQAVVVLLKDGSLWALSSTPGVAPRELSGLAELNQECEIWASEDGSKLLAMTAESDGPSHLRIWDLEEQSPSCQVVPDQGRAMVMYPASFSPDGRWLVFWRPDLSVSICDVRRFRVTASFSGYSLSPGNQKPSFSPDSTRVCLMTSTGCVIVNLADARVLGRVDRLPSGFAWSPNGERFAVYDAVGQRVVVYRASDVSEAQAFPSGFDDADDSFNVSLEWEPTGSMLAVSMNKQVRVYRAADGSVVANEATSALRPNRFVWLPDGISVATPDGVRNIQDGTLLREFARLDGVADPNDMSLHLSPDGSLLYRQCAVREGGASTSPYYAVDLIQTASGKAIGHYLTRNSLAVWSRDSTRLIAWGDTGVVVVDPSSGREFLTIDDSSPADVTAVGWTPDHVLLTFDKHHFLRSYDPMPASERKRQGRNSKTP